MIYFQRTIELGEIVLQTDKLLGIGHFGVVVMGKLQRKTKLVHHYHHEIVAVKTIHNQSSKVTVKFLMEMRLLAVMDHPNIVKLLGAQELYYPVLMVTEYCEAGDLRKCLRAGFDYLRQVGMLSTLEDSYLDMLTQISSAVAYLHSKLCIHRDLAARNILVVKDDQHTNHCGLIMKLADLGLARALKEESDYYKSSNEEEAVAIRWQCPVAVSSRIYSAKSDVYSFGILIWEIVHQGATPFSELKTMEVTEHVKSGHTLRWSLNDNNNVLYVTELEQLVESCTQMVPAQRPNMVWIGQTLKMIGEDKKVKWTEEKDYRKALVMNSEDEVETSL